MYIHRAPRLFAVVAILLLTGCLETLKVVTTPPGAQIAVDAKSIGVTPFDVQLEGRPQPYTLTVTKDGFETEMRQVTTGAGQKELAIELAPLTQTKRFKITSTPSGATVRLAAKELGTTPCEIELSFTRAGKKQPWSPVAVMVAKEDYETETATFTTDTTNEPPPVALTLLRAERTYRVSAQWAGRQTELKADLTLDRAALPQPTPADVHVVFARQSKRDPWPTFALQAEVPTRFQPHGATLTFDTPPAVVLALDPVTEIPVRSASAQVVIEPNTGAMLRVVAEERTGVLETGEQGTELTGLTRITDFRRHDNAPNTPLQILTAFALVPKGDAAVLSVATQDPHGEYVCGLRLVRTDGSFTPASLTDGTRYFDTAPVFSRYEQGNLTLVFQSNRADRAKPDIFRLTIDEKNYSPIGGIARITNDQRFNYGPTLADTAIGIVYLSVEPNYPLARPQLSTVKADGVLPTQFSIPALEVAQREMSTIYFVREDVSTRKKQIYSVQPDGKLETTLINDAALAASNCVEPSPAFMKDGRLLFVSDAGTNEHGRHNNDIYVMNADGTNVQRLTTNGSDDILPAWSPADNEPGVFYFISNRGGAYNLWRAKIADRL